MMETMQDKHEQLIEHLKGHRRVVINRCFGGFSLSDSAWQRYCGLIGWDHTDENLHDHMIARDDPYLVKTVEELGPQANGDFAELRIVEIPANVEWYVEDYDGQEHVAEKHRTWR